MAREELEQEIEAIAAIYPECLDRLSDTQCMLRVPEHEHVSVQVSFPTGYPTDVPPQVLSVQVGKASGDSRSLRDRLEQLMSEVWVQDVCIFDFLTSAGALCETEQIGEPSETPELVGPAELPDAAEPQQRPLRPLTPPVWFQSEPVYDRGSTFQAFAVAATSEDSARASLDLLRLEPKIARSQHVISAWRIHGSGSVTYQDCDDDGETAAGGRILHLLSVMDAWDVVVAVVRWFTGTHIGPDRFKHINSAAREAVLRGSFAEASKGGKKKK
ncbi:LAMI_0D08108g1_1 [Lachancea mirantina]|uniref:LAMI_0D08108g1_1 n=1 Tax=Lachancea mirantina TaxID=1230905 RepID=A0A1G4JCQ1_9SACH|nr:LAMI_0D08108g1_1 [Lachancea mirantina]